MVSKKSFYHNKHVLITGITGFIGSHLADTLQKAGAQVFGISRTHPDNHIYKTSLSDFDALERIIQKNSIHICFHLGGEALVEKGQENPYETFKDNILGTLTILELSRKFNLDRVVIASTSHVYGKNKVPYYEGYTPRPTRPYETSKAAVDMIGTSYANTFNLPILIPRFVNIYGPGDKNFSRIIPKTIKGIIEKNEVEVWSGNTKRDYLYIEDAVDAYLKLGSVEMKKIGTNRIFNFGTGETINAKDLVEKIITISGKDVSIKKLEDKRPSEIPSQYLSWNKSQKLLGWKPKVSLDDGLRQTISWYSEHID